MAAPIVGNFQVTSVAASQATGITLTKPTGLADNDVLYACVGGINAASGAEWACSGWTPLSTVNTTTGNDRVVTVLRKKITNASGEAASYTFAVTGASSARLAGIIFRVSGATSAATPEDATTTQSILSNSTDRKPTNPTITTATDNALLLCFKFGSMSSSADRDGGGAPTNFTQIGRINSPDDGTTVAAAYVEAAYWDAGTAGAKTPGAWTGSETVDVDEYATFTVAVKAAGVTVSTKTGTGTLAGVGNNLGKLFIASITSIPYTSRAQTTYSTDTAAFPVLVDDIVVAVGLADSGNTSVVTVTGSGLNFTKRQEITLGNQWPYNVIWTAPVTAANASQVVNFAATNGGTDHMGGTVYVIRGGNGIGASGKDNQSSPSTPSLSLTTSYANSIVVVGINDWNVVDGASRAWTTTPKLIEDAYLLDTGRYTTYVSHSINTGTAAAKTLGLTAPAGLKWGIVALEVYATAGVTDWTKTGTGTLSGVGSGTEVVATSETGTGTAAGVGSGTKGGTITTKTGTGTVAGVGSGTELAVTVETGIGTVAGVASGAKVKATSKTGTGTLSGVASGTDLATTVEIGTGTLSGVGSGAKVKATVKTGTGTVSGVGSGTDLVTTVEAGVGTASGVGSGTKTVTGVSTKTGTGTLSGVGSATDLVTTVESGVGTASGVGSGTKTVTGVSTKTGTGTAAGVGSATDLVVSTETGTGTLSGVGSGTRAVTRIVKVWDGNAWTTRTLQVWNGSTWITPTAVKTWDGNAWSP